MKSDIYISASRKDYEVVSKIKSILHSAGYTYFHEMESFEPGKFYDQNIRAEILEAKVFLCILSENSYTSYYIQKEIRFALKEKGEKQ